jgi:hypothetical protein
MDRRQFVAAVGGAAWTASVRSAEEQAKEPGKTVSPASGSAPDRARHDPDSYFHEIVTGEGVKPYLADNVMVTSADGFHC